MGLDGVFSDYPDRMMDAYRTTLGLPGPVVRLTRQSQCQSRLGQMTTNARPSRSSYEIGPRSRLSFDPPRLSPITNTCSSGTVSFGLVAAARVGRDHGGVEVRLDELAAVDVQHAVAVLDGLAGQADDPLDEVALAGALDGLQHHHVATVGVVQAIAELVDQHPVAVVQRGVHRVAGHRELLQHECPHDQRRGDRHDDDDDPLEPGVALLALASGGCGSDGSDMSSVSSGSPGLAHRRQRYPSCGRHGRQAASGSVQSEAMSFSTRSSRLRNGSLHSTVRWAWSLSLRCTQSTV